MSRLRTWAEIDLAAIRASTATLVSRAGSAAVMAVVKADGYGHGAVPAARAALAGGATWLGVAFLEEALALRSAGMTAPVLAWLIAPGEDLGAALLADVDVSAGSGWLVEQVAAAAGEAGVVARLHLEADTGLNRAGALPEQWAGLVDAAARAQADGSVQVVGVWSHLAYADAPSHPTIDAQLGAFQAAVATVERAGLRPQVRHLANSAATLTRPDTHFDLVRPGLAVYGLSPVPELGSPARLGLHPAMTLRSTVALTKRVSAGSGVSYGHTYTTERDTTLALVPLGYADGVPRAGTNTLPLLVAGVPARVAGRVCMDQLVVDLGDHPVQAGDPVTLFGPGEHGEPTAQDWAAGLGTINYEVVTRIGGRVPRRYVGA